MNRPMGSPMNGSMNRSPSTRPRLNPILVLTLLAALPGLALFGLWRWAQAEVSAAKKLSDPAPTVTIAPMATPLMSYRRAPQSLSDSITVANLRAALAPFSAFVADTSCFVASTGTRTVLDIGADRQVTPASNLKLFTGAAALEILGPDFTYETQLRGVVANGVVTGDLFFVGGGDPLLSTVDYPATQKHPPTSVTSLEALVQKLVDQGITQITGNIVGDESRYDAERSVPSWSPDLVGTEAGPLSALLVNDGVKDLGNQRRYDDPATGAATQLRTMLKNAKIQIGGKATVGVAPPEVPVLATISSAPFAEVLAEMLTTSDNNTAELVLKEIGHKVGTGGNRLAGIGAVQSVLVSWGVDTAPLVLIDGSGLDSGDIVTCRQVLKVIEHEKGDPKFLAALALAAGETGTLSDEFVGSPLAGLLRAKTGSLSNVKALSGVIPYGEGTLDFSLILNAQNANDAGFYRPIWDALAAGIAAAQVGPRVASLQPR